jgi:hypothetical protein
MATDVLALVSKVIDRAVEKSGHVLPSSLPTGEQPQGADALIDMLASHLLTFLGVGGSAGAGRPSTSELEQLCTTQMARNSILARALGACDCWGELPSCESCHGRGTSGWRPPERASFDVLVRPVLRKMRQHRFRVRPASGMAL